MKIKRLINPRTNAPGWLAGAAAVAAVITGLMHHKSVPAETWILAGVFVASLLVRTQTKPNADPYLPAGVRPGGEPSQVKAV